MFEQAVTQSDQIEAVLPVPGAVRFNGTLVAQNVMAPSGDHLNQGLPTEVQRTLQTTSEIAHQPS